MAISRSQMEEQIRGFATGGDPFAPSNFLSEPEPDPFDFDPLPQNIPVSYTHLTLPTNREV